MPKGEGKLREQIEGAPKEPAEQLDAENATLAMNRDPAQAVRRRIEAHIEKRAKAKRQRQKPASANFKRSA